MADYVVSPEAARDLDWIFDIGLENFGIYQAIRFQDQLHAQFQLLADFPGIGGRPLSGVSREVFRSPFASHIIIYEKTDSGVLIARIFHGNIEDVRRLL